ncbi:TPM domain-containing protein [Ornithinimicrobium sufpigmenti]|uniref:TPM domain-containing protein n=1 Tax=Ornithinimicrobium sufpigmenti TaxID=2508882 RepID=UPI0015E16CF7|nr:MULTISPECIES: TPM domain-containing protein [unclassified Ornithinimicrobium]
MHRARTARLLVTGVLTGLALTLPVGTAVAVPPFDLPAELVDEQGVLADPEAVRAAQDAYFEESRRQVFVVVVDDLAGWEPAAWLAETARLSGLGEEDLALLVVADADTDTGTDGDTDGDPGADTDGEPGAVTAALLAPEGAGLPPGAMARTEGDISAAAAGGDADEVVRAALAGLRAAGVDRPGDATVRTLWWAAVAILVLAVAGTVTLWLTQRARTATREAAARVRAEELSGTLGTLVVELDDALEEAQLELDLASARVDGQAGAATLAQAQATVRLAREEAVEVHRRRSALSLGPTADLTWRVPPGEAVAELEELHTLTRSAHDRVRGLQLPA